VVDPADAVEVRQAVEAVADHSGPVYLRLKRGEVPEIFGEDHRFDLDRAQVLTGEGPADASIMAAGMMIPTALTAARALADNGLAVSVLNVPVIKPLDADTVVAAARRSHVVVTTENHTVVGGLGSAVAEALAEAGSATPLRRVGIGDVFGESGSREYLFTRYGLSTQHIVDTVWRALAINRPVPTVPAVYSAPGEYAPV